MEWLSNLIDMIPSAELASVASIAMVLEFGFRLLKTKKPLSIAWMVADCLKLLSVGFGKLAALMDKVLPQRTAE
jgi:hypothetical protein